MRLGFDEPPPCKPHYEATRTYTEISSVVCGEYRITVSRTVCSEVSMRDAQDRALELAKCEAKAAMDSYIRTQTVCPGIEVNYFDTCPPAPPPPPLSPVEELVATYDNTGAITIDWTAPDFVPNGITVLVEGPFFGQSQTFDLLPGVPMTPQVFWTGEHTITVTNAGGNGFEASEAAVTTVNVIL